MSTTIKIRRDTLTNWQTENPTPYEGELCLVTDLTPQRIKIGDGTTPFNSLPYFTLPNATTSAAGLMAAADKLKLDNLPNSPITAQGGLRIAGRAVGDAVRAHFTITGGAYTYTVPDTPLKLAAYKGNGYSNESLVLAIGDHDVYHVYEDAITVPKDAFNGLSNVTEIELPSFIRKIGDKAFKDTGITKLVCRSPLPPTLGTDVFSGVDRATLTVFVYADHVTDYTNDAGWNAVGTITALS